MKFTVEYRVLMKMLELVGKRMPGQKRADANVKLSACAARVFVEANGTTAGVEALVLEDGECVLPRIKFVQVLKTYRGRKNLTMEADVEGLRIGSFTLRVEGFRPHASPPARFQVFPVTDLDVLTPEQTVAGVAENRSAPATRETEPPPVAPPAQPVAPPLPPGPNVAKKSLPWEFFAPETLERLFVVYTHKYELEWAERMWAVLGKRGLTGYSTAVQYNQVLARLAVLARYFKCWVWRAYGDADDPYGEYDEWFEALPFVRSALPRSAAKESTSESPEIAETTLDLLDGMIRAENDIVFETVMASYGDWEGIELALDLRHAAGLTDEFDDHIRLSEPWPDQEAFFKKYGLSMREFDCAEVVIGNRFYF
jgi:hypothetical protein